jgi:alkaline phosphatase D
MRIKSCAWIAAVCVAAALIISTAVFAEIMGGSRDMSGLQDKEAHAKRLIPGAPITWAPLPRNDQPLSRIAFGSCAFQYLDQPIWSAIARTRPNLFLNLGDIIYADMLPYNGQYISPDLNVVEKARVDYALQAAHANFREFAEHTPMMLTWDDHDRGQDDGGADFAHQAQMKELFLEFVGAKKDDKRRGRAGVYISDIFGPVGRRVQVIMLDTRSFRSPLTEDTRTTAEKEKLNIVGRYVPTRDPNATFLGEEQWAWLGQRLKEPAEVRLIASSVQVIASEKGVESWGNFPKERKRLYSLIEETRAEGVVLLSGDVHFAEISKTDESPYPLYDFTSSGLKSSVTHWGKYINSYRIRGTLDTENFGLVEIDWTQPDPVITLRGLDGQGKEGFRQEVRLSDLKFKHALK